MGMTFQSCSILGGGAGSLDHYTGLSLDADLPRKGDDLV